MTNSSIHHRRICWLPILIAPIVFIRGSQLNSPVTLEIPLIASGIYAWEQMDSRPFAVNPPLPRLLSGGVLYLYGVRIPLNDFDKSRINGMARPEFFLGDRFEEEYILQLQSLVELARIVAAVMGTAATLFLFLLARSLWNETVAAICALIFLFEPFIVTASFVATTDIAAICGALFISFAARIEFLNRDDNSLALLGFAIGVGILCKFTVVPFAFVAAVISLWNRISFARRSTEKSRRSIRPFFHALIALTVMPVAMLWIAYLPFSQELKSNEWRSNSYLTSDNPLQHISLAENYSAIPVCLLPPLFVHGIDLQLNDFQVNPQPALLAGKWSEKGSPYYYLYGIFIKTSPLTHILLICSILVSLLSKSPWRITSTTIYLLVSNIAVIVLLSVRIENNEHIRYSLPVASHLPLLAGLVYGYFKQQQVFLKNRICLQSDQSQEGLCKSKSKINRLRGSLVVICVLLILIKHHSIAYITPLGRAFLPPPYHLSGTGFDQGQDLYRLRDYLDEQGDSRILYAGFAGVHPMAIGITCEPLDPQTLHDLDHDKPTSISLDSPTIAVVSLSLIAGGTAFSIPNRHGIIRKYERGDFSGLSLSERFHAELVGDTFLVLHLQHPIGENLSSSVLKRRDK